MYITIDQHTKLSQDLFDKIIELRKAGVKSIQKYTTSLQDVIESVFPSMRWQNVTNCNISDHLMKHKNPVATVIAILKGLKED